MHSRLLRRWLEEVDTPPGRLVERRTSEVPVVEEVEEVDGEVDTTPAGWWKARQQEDEVPVVHLFLL